MTRTLATFFALAILRLALSTGAHVEIRGACPQNC
jgi:hypothetical protein